MTPSSAPRARARLAAKLLAALLLAGFVATACTLTSGVDPAWIRPDNRPTTVEGASNGRLTTEQLFTIEGTSCKVFIDAADHLNDMFQAAKRDGVSLTAGSCYRDYAGQVATRQAWCAQGLCHMAAVPGTSNHGWGKAADFRSGSSMLSFNSAAYQWMKEHAGEYGWNHPGWAEPNGSAPEAWHWEWVGDGGTLFANGATPSPRIRTVEPPAGHDPVHEVTQANAAPAPPPAPAPAPAPAAPQVQAPLTPVAPAPAPAPNPTAAPAPAPAPAPASPPTAAPAPTAPPVTAPATAKVSPSTTSPASPASGPAPTSAPVAPKVVTSVQAP